MMASVSLSSHSCSYVYMVMTTGARKAKKSKLTGMSMSARLRVRVLIRAASFDLAAAPVMPPAIMLVDTSLMLRVFSAALARLFIFMFCATAAMGNAADADATPGDLVAFFLNFFDCCATRPRKNFPPKNVLIEFRPICYTTYKHTNL